MKKLKLDKILKQDNPVEYLCDYAEENGRLPKEYEDIILKSNDIDYIARYAENVIEERWPEAEPILAEKDKVSWGIYVKRYLMSLKYIPILYNISEQEIYYIAFVLGIQPKETIYELTSHIYFVIMCHPTTDFENITVSEFRTIIDLLKMIIDE